MILFRLTSIAIKNQVSMWVSGTSRYLSSFPSLLSTFFLFNNFLQDLGMVYSLHTQNPMRQCLSIWFAILIWYGSIVNVTNFWNNVKSSKDRTKLLGGKEAKFYYDFSDINYLKIRLWVTAQRLDE